MMNTTGREQVLLRNVVPLLWVIFAGCSSKPVHKEDLTSRKESIPAVVVSPVTSVSHTCGSTRSADFRIKTSKSFVRNAPLVVLGGATDDSGRNLAFTSGTGDKFRWIVNGQPH